VSFFYNTDSFIDNDYGALDNETLLAEIKRRADEEAAAAKAAAAKEAADKAAADAAKSGLSTSTIDPSTVTETDAQRFSRIGAQLARGENVNDGDYDFFQQYGSRNPPKSDNSEAEKAALEETRRKTVLKSETITMPASQCYSGKGVYEVGYNYYGETISKTFKECAPPFEKEDPPPPGGNSGGESTENKKVDATPPTPLKTSLLSTPPPPPKTAPIDTIIFDDDAVPIEVMSDLILEDIGGHELINIARNDTINGQIVSYQPIKNLSSIQQQYNPNNVVSLQDTSDRYFANFSIKLETSLIEEGEGSGPDGAYIFIDSDGDLVVELLNVDPDQQMEVEISQSGTIYEASI